MRRRTIIFLMVLFASVGMVGCDRPLALNDDGEGGTAEILPVNVLYEPHLIRPKNGSFVRSSASVTLHWSWIPSAEKYTVQVARDSLFTNMVLDATADTTFYRTPMLGSSTFYWRVRSHKGTKVSIWSSRNIFYLQVQ